jgi:hypothetical protein
MNNRIAVRRKVNPFAVGLVASYCKNCGLLIAASIRRKTLDVMEHVHRCPVYFHYEQKPEAADALEVWPSPVAGRQLHYLIYLK